MARRIAGVVLAIIAIIALIGSVFLIYVLFEFSTAISMVPTEDLALMSQFGVDTGQMTTVISTVQNLLMIGLAWCITVIITALYALYTSINMVRVRRKK